MLGYRLKALKLNIEYVVGEGAQEQIPDEKDGAIEDGSVQQNTYVASWFGAVCREWSVFLSVSVERCL